MRRRALRLAALLFSAGCSIAALAGPAQAELSYEKSIGGLSTPHGVAANDTTGDFYVIDRFQYRVAQYTSDGTFIRTWGVGVNQTTGGNICTAASGDTCGAGTPGTGPGGFRSAQAIAVDNSGGPSNGSVYVYDGGNYRVQKFTADGQFIRTWGRSVNLTTGGNLCTAASGDECKEGEPSGKPGTQTEAPVPSLPGEFAAARNPFTGAPQPSEFQQITVDGSGFVYVGDGLAIPNPRVQKFDPDGGFVGMIAPPSGFNQGISFIVDIAANDAGDLYLADSVFGLDAVKRFDPSDFTPTGETAEADLQPVFAFKKSASRLAVDPTTQYLYVKSSHSPGCDPEIKVIVQHYIELWAPNGESVDCTQGTPTPSIVEARGIAVSAQQKLYVTKGSQVHIFNAPAPSPPDVADQKSRAVTTSTAAIDGVVSGNLSPTDVHVEYGTDPCSSNLCESTPDQPFGASVRPKSTTINLKGLTPNTRYYYRVVAENVQGSDSAEDLTFRTYPEPTFDPLCPNNLARQQTGAAMLLDCRAYELVSAEDQGGYNVESDLVPNGEPFGGYPLADDKALYAVHDGGIPGIGKPNNRGPDPYVATREPENRRWRTEYVGIPSDAPSTAPFSPTVAGIDGNLENFAFGGDEICDPCFSDGSAGMPLRQGDGNLEQGMVGSMPVADPEPAGEVHRPLSEDGSHFIFGSEQQFEPAGNPNDGNVTIYDRDLGGGGTQVVSTLSDGSTMASGDDVAALDVSADGSRILIGRRVSTDTAGNDYFDLYMHVGTSPNSVEVADTPSGVLFAGMTSDGSQVYFTTPDPLTGETDTSADLFRASVGGTATVERVSSAAGAGDTDSCDPAGNSYNPENWNTIPGGPTDCSVVAVGGGGGVAGGNGTVYFLSPEKLDGSGVDGAPNLFIARPGDDPHLVATLESGANVPVLPSSPQFDRYMGSFAQPLGAAIERESGAMYVYDANNGMIPAFGGSPDAYVQKFDSSGNPDSTFDGDSKLTGFYADGVGLIGEFIKGEPIPYPTQIAVDNTPTSASFGDVYVPTHDGFFSGSVKRYSSTGVFEKTLEGFEFPSGVSVHPLNGKVYVSAFTFESFVQVFSDTGTFEKAWSVSAATPRGLAVDSNNKVYVAIGNAVRVYDGTTGAFTGTLSANPAYGVAVDPAVLADPNDDIVYVDQGDRIRAYDAAGNLLGSPIGVGKISESVSFGADSGNLVASNPGGGNVAVFKAAVPSDPTYDHPAVVNGVRESQVRHTGDFQTTPSGDYAVVPSIQPLTGFGSNGKYEIFRYDVLNDQLDCTSCTPTESAPSTHATLASNGLSILEDGRVFFTSGEPLVLRDTAGTKDAYEWKDGVVELISTGTSDFDSGLLSATADGTDVFFFTREKLASNDLNGNVMKIYTAREDGGFFVIPPPPQCAAADECHGAGSPAPGPPGINTVTRKDGNVDPDERACDRLERRAKRFAQRANGLRRRRARGGSGESPARLAKQVRRAEQAAKRASRAAKRCRSARRNK